MSGITTRHLHQIGLGRYSPCGQRVRSGIRTRVPQFCRLGPIHSVIRTSAPADGCHRATVWTLACAGEQELSDQACLSRAGPRCHYGNFAMLVAKGGIEPSITDVLSRPDRSGGRRIRTADLKLMRLPSFLAALPRYAPPTRDFRSRIGGLWTGWCPSRSMHLRYGVLKCQVERETKVSRASPIPQGDYAYRLKESNLPSLAAVALQASMSPRNNRHGVSTSALPRWRESNPRSRFWRPVGCLSSPDYGRSLVLVGQAGFEPTISSSQERRGTTPLQAG